MNQIVVSVVLNMHREALYLRPTLLSLDACARQASESGIHVELIAVFDRPDPTTLEVFHSTKFEGFERVRTTEIDVGSLGLARNAGIALAEGEYIWTVDGDDLVSRNAIVELHNAVQSQENQNRVALVEFCVAFGEPYHIGRYFGSEWLLPADYAFQHPFVSRVFLPRAAFEDLKYQDLRVSNGFAYEDWDLNVRLLAEGYEFVVAPETVFFYRQRPNSLLKQANAASVRTIPNSKIFEPGFFVHAMTEARLQRIDWNEFTASRRSLFERDFAAELLASELLVQFTSEAAILEPEIQPRRIEGATSYCPVPWGDRHWGFQLEALYRMLGSQDFTDVLLLPWLKPGGAEKYILQILQELQDQGRAEKILVVTGQRAASHEWVDRLPEGSVFIDLYNAFPHLSEQERTTLIVRAILAVAYGGARLHLKSSEFAHGVMDRFGAVLAGQMEVVYYRFCDDSYVWGESRLSDPWGVRHIRDHASSISMMISDCSYIQRKDFDILGSMGIDHHVVYASCDVRGVGRAVEVLPRYRFMWASRISSQKRPELLLTISRLLSQRMPNVVVDVYGSVDERYDRRQFDYGALRYKGHYADFSQLPVERYDGLLYTSGFDGLPNVILEALGAGLPVIAPAIGGIPEAVINGETGILLDDDVSDDALAESYVQAIERVYREWTRWKEMSDAGRALILTRHSKSAQAEGVRMAFENRIGGQ